MPRRNRVNIKSKDTDSKFIWIQKSFSNLRFGLFLHTTFSKRCKHTFPRTHFIFRSFAEKYNSWNFTGFCWFSEVRYTKWGSNLIQAMMYCLRYENRWYMYAYSNKWWTIFSIVQIRTAMGDRVTFSTSSLWCWRKKQFICTTNGTMMNGTLPKQSPNRSIAISSTEVAPFATVAIKSAPSRRQIRNIEWMFEYLGMYLQKMDCNSVSHLLV